MRKAVENNNAGRIDSAQDKRIRLDSSDDQQPAVASNVGDANGAPAARAPAARAATAPGAAERAAERHREDHVVGAHAFAARDGRRTISEAAAAVAAESDVDEALHVAAARNARNARRRIGYKAKHDRRSRTTASGRVVTTQHIIA